jgi:hypothetical protein
VQIPKMEDPKWSFFIPGLLVKFTIHGWLNSKKHPITVGWFPMAG